MPASVGLQNAAGSLRGIRSSQPSTRSTPGNSFHGIRCAYRLEGKRPEGQARKPPETIRVEAASWQWRPVYIDTGGKVSGARRRSAPGLLFLAII